MSNTGRCTGTIHTFPVPPGMTPEDSWTEIRMFGYLQPYEGIPTWANFRCPGHENCVCFDIEHAPSFRRYSYGRLIRATVFGLEVPVPLLRIVSGWDQVTGRASEIRI